MRLRLDAALPWRPSIAFVVLLSLALSLAGGARARILFDFEGPYLTEPGRSLKDHALVWDGSQWHMFYIRGVFFPDGTREETSFGHATSNNLRNWRLYPTVLPVQPGTWEDQRVWAPFVLPSPSGSGWTMLYTGVTNFLLQRMGRADSPDLFSWTRAPENPVLEPDSTVYYWAPSIDYLSAFRDPYVFEMGGQYHALNTVLLRDETVASGYRGAVHHAVSSDLSNWTEVAPLAQNNSTNGGVQRELESVHLIEHDGTWYLFLTISGQTGVRWMKSSSFDSGWDFDTLQLFEAEGVAAEVTPLDANSWIYTRYARTLHSTDHPNPAKPFYAIRADTLRFDAQGDPQIVWAQPLAEEWPEREGTAFGIAPIFGDNSVERGEIPTRPIGHGYLSSREAYGGPLLDEGSPGDARPLSETGRIRSVFFEIAPTDSVMSFLMAGTDDPDCRLELVERVSADGEPLVTELRRTAQPIGNERLELQEWDVSSLRGATVRLELIDDSTTGWIALDYVQVRDTTEIPVSAPALRTGGVEDLRAVPNPFNPRTRVEFRLERRAAVTIDVVDTRGRRIRRVDLGSRTEGHHDWVWDGSDDEGRSVASGAYLVRVSTSDGGRTLRAVLVR